jgi:hypothetical protein
MLSGVVAAAMVAAETGAASTVAAVKTATNAQVFNRMTISFVMDACVTRRRGTRSEPA